MTSYTDLLRDPRWQKKRLETLSRDKFTCQACGDTKMTLNVHHCYYQAGCAPWEYPDRSLVTLCEPCHQLETSRFKEGREMLIASFARRGHRSACLLDFATAMECQAFYDSLCLLIYGHHKGVDATGLASHIADYVIERQASEAKP